MNKANKKYYRLLHVQPDAPQEIIRSSYQTLMQRMKIHPDLGGNGEHAAALNEAYAVLSSPEARRAYDRLQEGDVQSRSVQVPSELPRTEVAICAFCKVENSTLPSASDEESCANCGSPLGRMAPSGCQETGRRTLARVPKNDPIEYYTHWSQHHPQLGRSFDISLDGMRFCCVDPLQEGQVLKITSATLTAVARVTRAEPLNEEWIVGVVFLTIQFRHLRGSFISNWV